MEKFTRECLEIDVTSGPAFMSRVYHRAAKLIRRTLEVDGAMILDVGQLETNEVIGDDGKKSKIFRQSPKSPSIIFLTMSYRCRHVGYWQRGHRRDPFTTYPG